MIAGIVLFSGSLFVLALSGIKVLGAITPLGGTAFLIGLICLLLAPAPARNEDEWDDEEEEGDYSPYDDYEDEDELEYEEELR